MAPNEPMKALTLWQPWASLVALGVKTIETRSWSTRYRGPLAIHAATRRVHTGKFLLLARTAYNAGKITKDQEYPFRSLGVPFGAVVATADLIDVVPIIDGSIGWTEDSDTPPAAIVVSWDSAAMLVDTVANDATRVTDQLPYGDFAPGRYAWLLDNIEAFDEPVPAKGRQGLWTWGVTDGTE